VYYTAQWAHTFQPADLVKAAAAVLCGTLVRYDGWALAVTLASIVLYIAWRKRGRPFAESSVILYGVLGFAGCVGWLIYNQIILGNALAFYNGPSSTKAQQSQLAKSGGLPSLHNPGLSLHVYAQAALDNLWFPLACCAILGLIMWMARTRFALSSLPLYALLVPFAFNWLSLVLGISIVETPEIRVNGVATYFNVRYGMMMIPAAALFISYLGCRHRLLVSGALAILLGFTVAGTFIGTPYVLQDPMHGIGQEAASQTIGTWLHEHYRGGNLLLSYTPFAPVMFRTNLPDGDFITDSNGAEFTSALAHPERATVWIVMDDGNVADPVWTALGKRQDWRQHFLLRQTFDSDEIYERIDSLIGPSAGAPAPASTATPSPVVVATPSPTAVPSPTPVPRPTPRPTPVPTPRPTPSPSPTPTPTPTPSPTPSPTPTPTPSPAPTPTAGAVTLESVGREQPWQ